MMIKIEIKKSIADLSFRTSLLFDAFYDFYRMFLTIIHRSSSYMVNILFKVPELCPLFNDKFVVFKL